MRSSVCNQNMPVYCEVMSTRNEKLWARIYQSKLRENATISITSQKSVYGKSISKSMIAMRGNYCNGLSLHQGFKEKETLNKIHNLLSNKFLICAQTPQHPKYKIELQRWDFRGSDSRQILNIRNHLGSLDISGVRQSAFLTEIELGEKFHWSAILSIHGLQLRKSRQVWAIKPCLMCCLELQFSDATISLGRLTGVAQSVNKGKAPQNSARGRLSFCQGSHDR